MFFEKGVSGNSSFKENVRRPVMETWAGKSRRVCCQGGSDSSSTWRTPKKVLLAFALLFIFVLAGLEPCGAQAATWPVSASELSPSVGFQEEYSAGDSSYAHSGIDIPASAGMQISTPLAGTVSFTGAVPSGDSRTSGASAQKTMRAVSVKIPSGKTVTLMPFASVEVKRGAKVAEGQALGTLAASGDVSSQGPHLHMGLKRDGVYYDPMALFGAGATDSAAPAPKAAQAGDALAANPGAALGEGAAAPVAHPGTAPAHRGASETYGKPAGGLAGEPAGSSAKNPAAQGGRAGGSVPAGRAWSPGTVSSGELAWQPPARREPAGPLAAIGAGAAAAASSLARSCAVQGAAFLDGLEGLSQGTGIPIALVYLGVVALAVGAFAGGIYGAVRWVVPFVSSLWKSRIAPLCRANLGARMHKLFPAPGSAFITRGR